MPKDLMFDKFWSKHPTKIVETDDLALTFEGEIPAGDTLIVTSKGFSGRGVVKSLVDGLTDRQTFVFDAVTPNPALDDVKRLIAQYQHKKIRNIVALGGGSAIDTAKVLRLSLSSQITHPKLMLVNTPEHTKSNICLLVIPTTAGTGAEVTPFATIWDNEKQQKLSLIGPCPNVALLNSAITISLSGKDTLYPALDALSHSLESLWNKNRTNFSAQAAFTAITLIINNLPAALAKPTEIDARRSLQQAATLAGIAITETKTAIAHAISYPLTLKYGVPHGLACSFTLAAIIREFGFSALKLEGLAVDNLLNMLDSLVLAQELGQYVDAQSLMNIAKLPMDSSRAGNFLLPIRAQQLSRIIEKSAGHAGGIL